MLIIQSGDKGQRTLFSARVHICEHCKCLFMASDKDFRVNQEYMRVEVDCPECGYGLHMEVVQE